jgi:hypothetical protein
VLISSDVLKSSMSSGTWEIIIEGDTFAYVRTFTLTVGTPVVVTVSLPNFNDQQNNDTDFDRLHQQVRSP